MEIVQERLEREYKISIINTVPNVIYHVILHNGDMIEIDNPTKLPPPGNIVSPVHGKSARRHRSRDPE